MTAAQPTALRVALLFLTAASLLVWSLDSLWGTSTDLAHHYALVARLSELWSMPYSGNATLGEMNYYPRSSHIMAAVVGRTLGSALLGMQVITLLGIIVLWGSLVSLVLSVPKKVGWIAALLLATALWVNRSKFQIELGAEEVIGNFFYAQLVAQAFVMLVVALALALERKGVNATLRYTLLVAGIYVAAGMHLLPALELLCFFGALVGVELHQKGVLRTKDWRAALVPVLLLLGAAAALLTHPSFAAMSGISNNNGTITARTIQSMHAFMGYSGLHMLFSAVLLLLWLRLDPVKLAPHWLGLKYMALFGFAISGLCLLQALALQLGHGSEYSVKKYIFALNTSLLIELVLFVTLLVYRCWPGGRAGRSGNTNNTAPTVADFLAPALTVVAFMWVTPAAAPLDTSNLVALEHQLQLQRDLLLPNLPGKFNYLAQIDGLPDSVAYMMSIGVLKAPRAAHPDLATPNWWIDNWGQVATVVTSQNSPLDQDPACRRAAPVNTLVMLDGNCVGKLFPRRHLMGFTTSQDTSTCTATGLGAVEPMGAWTIRTQATLRCPVPALSSGRLRTIEVDAIAFLDKVPAQRVSIAIKGQPPIAFVFEAGKPASLMVIDLPPQTGPEVQIDFSLPDAISPQQLGLSPDTRQLGIFIKTLEFK